MRHGGHVNTALTSPTSICCGRRLKCIDVATSSSHLAFTYCSRCESMRWFRDGVPTVLGEAVEDMRTISPAARRVTAG